MDLMEPLHLENYREPFLLVIFFMIVFLALFGLKRIFIGLFPQEGGIIKKSSLFLIAITLFAILVPNLPFGIPWHPLATKIGLIAFMVQVGIWVSVSVPTFVKSLFRASDRSDATLKSALPIVSLSVKVLLWILILLFVVDNLGFDVTALLTGLGIGGIAIALGAQNILSDIFASLSIILDRPFHTGDLIEVDGVTGYVEEIGLKTTRIKSQTGEQVIFANAELLKMRIRNYSRMEERRIQLHVSLAITNPEERWEEVAAIMEETVLRMEGVRFDRASLSSYTSNGLIYEVIFYALNPLPVYGMERQQHFLTSLAKSLKEKGLALADPSVPVLLL